MKNEEGQAVLIVLLVMAVVLTIVLSVLGSSTSDIKISSNETESLRAFSAAESGIEKALVTNLASQGSVGNANFNATVSSLAAGTKFFNYPSDLVTGDVGILWFVSHAASGSFICDASNPCFTGKTVKVCWGKVGTASNLSTTPALDLTFYYLTTPGDYSTVRVGKAVFDPNPTRLANNSYVLSDPCPCTAGTTNYAFGKVLDLSTLPIPLSSYNNQNGLQFLSARLLYNTDQDQSLGFDLNFAGNGVIPSQGQQVDSTGNLNTATRKIEVTSPYAEFPPILDTAIFSPSGVAQ